MFGWTLQLGPTPLSLNPTFSEKPPRAMVAPLLKLPVPQFPLKAYNWAQTQLVEDAPLSHAYMAVN